MQEGISTIDKNLKSSGIDVHVIAGKAGEAGNAVAGNAEKMLKKKGIDVRGSA
jgi:hypothetical protein